MTHPELLNKWEWGIDREDDMTKTLKQHNTFGLLNISYIQCQFQCVCVGGEYALPPVTTPMQWYMMMCVWLLQFQLIMQIRHCAIAIAANHAHTNNLIKYH